MNRKPIFAANWKMNKGPSETEDFARNLLSKIQNRTFPCDIVIAPPFVSLAKAAEMFGNVPAVALAAQNCSQFDSGAYTGEISAMMLKEFFVHYVIIGHSERRAIYGETDEVINAKVRKAREVNFKPIFCIGETLEERESGQLEKVLRTQVTKGLDGLTERDLLDTVIAYEPVWAIGTGRTPSTADVAEVHAAIRQDLESRLGTAGSRVRILYGGSVKPQNARELLALPNVDGALVGGASLKADDFLAIVRAAN